MTLHVFFVVKNFFSVHCELSKDTVLTGNYGLLDQQTAIKFIYDHASTIGGDKNRITIGGESGNVKILSF